MKDSKIEWTHHTFNPWIGCSKIHEGCAHCYAEADFDSRRGVAKWGLHGTRVLTSLVNWGKVLSWDRKAAAVDERHRVFCASLADVFEDWSGPIQHHTGVPMLVCDCGTLYAANEIEGESWFCPCGKSDSEFKPASLSDVRRRLFTLIDATPNLDWLLLTKRPENILRMWKPTPGVHGKHPSPDYEQALASNWRPNVWLGTSVSLQEHADRQIPELLKCRALSPVLFLSCEPLLGPVDLELEEVETGVNWVIAGGESGTDARPMHPEWARSLRDQCDAAEVPFLFKQWGEYGPEQISDVRFTPVPSGISMDEPASMFRVGKKLAGRMLDGRTWDEFPVESVVNL